MGGEEEAAVDCTKHMFTVNDASLFLFWTIMTQLVNSLLGGLRLAVVATDDNSDIVVGNGDERNGNACATLSSSPSLLSSCVADGGGLRFNVFERPLDVLGQGTCEHHPRD
jgi:hypothetical protein